MFALKTPASPRLLQRKSVGGAAGESPGWRKEARDAWGKCECGGIGRGLKNISRLGNLSDEIMKEVVFSFFFLKDKIASNKKIKKNSN